MPLFPYEKFRIESPLSPREAHDVLAAGVEPSGTKPRGQSGASFQGDVSIDSFRIWRIIRYRNSFLPQIRGRIAATANGSIVEGTMALHPVILWFMIVWFGGLALIIGSNFVPVMISQRVWPPGATVGLGMIAFGWTLTSLAFSIEARKAKSLLIGMLMPSDRSSPVSSRGTAPVNGIHDADL